MNKYILKIFFDVNLRVLILAATFDGVMYWFPEFALHMMTKVSFQELLEGVAGRLHWFLED